jgi:hypothetical protein
MEIKINSHPEGVPETGGASMGSTYYSIHHHIVFSTKERCQIRAEIFVATVMIIRMYDSGTPSGCDSFSPLIRGYRKAQPPATISHPSGMKMEKLWNSCVEVVKYDFPVLETTGCITLSLRDKEKNSEITGVK